MSTRGPVQVGKRSENSATTSRLLILHPPAILHVHLLFTNPNPVFKLQLLPLQNWQTELQVKGVAAHWPLEHVSPRVHLLPSSHATPLRFDHVLVLLLGLHHWKKRKYQRNVYVWSG